MFNVLTFLIKKKEEFLNFLLTLKKSVFTDIILEHKDHTTITVPYSQTIVMLTQ